jgi:hypothetical protein
MEKKIDLKAWIKLENMIISVDININLKRYKIIFDTIRDRLCG